MCKLGTTSLRLNLERCASQEGSLRHLPTVQFHAGYAITLLASMSVSGCGRPMAYQTSDKLGNRVRHVSAQTAAAAAT